MLRSSLESPIVKSGGKMENFADKVILAQSTLILYNPKNFDTANGMFHFDAVREISALAAFCSVVRSFPLGFFMGCCIR